MDKELKISKEFWDFIEANVPNYHERDDVLRQATLQTFIDDGDDTYITGITREEAIILRDRILFDLYYEAIDNFTREEQLSNCETLADIAYDAGYARLRFSNDSRARISEIIYWAKEFNKLHKDTDWYEEDYLQTVCDYIDKKISEHQKPLDMSCPHCGHQAMKYERNEFGDKYYTVICPDCGCQIEGEKARCIIKEKIGY